MPPPFSPNDWRDLEPLIDALLDASPDRRERLLADFSGGDAARRAELERLVTECETDLPVIQRPAADQFAALFKREPPRIPTALVERYQIEREVGRGGMASVYLARDRKHPRNVAIKVLHPELAAALGREQFLREIEIVAALRHPNVVPLFDSGEAEDVLYYVMPYEEGHSLRERLVRDGPLSVDDALTILCDVCEALGYAHACGVIHRDIKPDNILLSGRHAMVADFGLASAVTAASHHPVLEGLGLLLGTPAYMAPEQAPGTAQLPDHRVDIYAVGVLAYEVLTGSPPFDGTSPRQILAAHATETPVPIAERRPEVPNALADAIMTCLGKRPADRWPSIDELRVRLQSVSAVASGTTAAVQRQSRWRGSRTAILAAAAASLAALAAVLTPSSPDRPRPFALGRVTQLTSDHGLEVQPTLSPDGKRVAYAAGHSLRMHIYVRPLDGGRPALLTPDTAENQWFPRWSPDGSRILFLARGGVLSAPVDGGAARLEVAGRKGLVVTSATWSRDGREIVYSRGDSLLARSLPGGTDRLITVGTDLHSCNWSPNDAILACVAGNSFYVTVGKIFGLGPMFGNHAPSRIVLVPAAGGTPVTVTDSGSLHQSPVWSPDGRMLYYVSNRHGTRDVYVVAMRQGVPLAGGPVRLTTGLGAHSIALTSDGAHVVYAVYRSSANVWALSIPRSAPVSAAGAVPVTSGNQTVEGVRISGDRRWLVYDSDLSGNSDIYRVSLAGGEPERITKDSLDEFRGAISSDGREMTYHTFQTGARNVFLLPLGGGPIRQLTTGVKQRSMANWSPDGNALTMFDMATNDVLVMRRDARGGWESPKVIAKDGWRPEWSPDGGSVVFVSPTSGRIGIAAADSGTQRDIYVPDSNDPLAELAIYADDGRALYFKSHDDHLPASFWAIPVTGGKPRLLVRFDDPERVSNRFDFATDGARFYFTIEDRQSDIWVADVVRR